MSHVGNDAELGNFHDHEDEDLTDEDEADEAIFFQGIEDKLNALEKNTPSFANQGLIMWWLFIEVSPLIGGGGFLFCIPLSNRKIK